MMTVLDLFEDSRQFAAQSLVEPDAEDLTDAMGCQTAEPEFAASLEDLVDREVTFENEVATVMCRPRLCGRLWGRSPFFGEI